MQSLTLAYGAFVLGTLFEIRRLSGNWKDVGISILGSVLLTVMIVLWYWKHSVYWQLIFAGSLLLAFMVFHPEKLTAKIGEGVTLLHSLTLLYLLAEFIKKIDGDLWWLAFGSVPVAYSLLHALTYIRITKRDRLYLSLWSSFTMAVFASLYIYSVWQMDKVEVLLLQGRFVDGARVFLEYFLLGASGAYIAQNFFMLFAYMPGKRNFFNEAYFRSIQEMNQQHIERYSSDQVDRREACLVLLLVGGLLAANYYFAVLGVQFSISICLVLVPFFMDSVRRYF